MDDPTVYPMGLAIEARNMRFLLETASTRFGIKRTIAVSGKVRGLSVLNFKGENGLSDADLPLIFTDAGKLWRENASGSGTLAELTSDLVSMPSAAYAQMAQGFNKEFIAFTDLKKGLIPPALVNGETGALAPASGKPVGLPWAKSTAYRIGELITPTIPNGHWYRCDAAGTSHATTEPTWPTGVSSTVSDNGITWREKTPIAASTASAGNICSGTRYMVVLFKDQNGLISGMSDALPVQVVIAAPGFTLLATPIPIGPSNTTARILAFTIPGDTAVGLYHYIPKTETVEGITMTSTMIEDNTTTTATVNFTDDYLLAAADVSDLFDRIEVPPSLDVYFSERLQAMVYTRPKGFESGFLISDRFAGGAVNGTSSFISPGGNDGDVAVSWRDVQGVSYTLKANSGHQVTPNSNVPSTWNVVERWRGCGPCGVRAVDVGGVSSGGESTNQFMVFAHKSGMYRFEHDAPVPVFREVAKLWQDRVNWDVQHKIWLKIDDEASEVLIGLPLDGSTEISHVLKLNYRRGWGEPISFARSAQSIAQSGVVVGRRWSLYDYPAGAPIYSVVIGKRTLATPVDPVINNRQLLFASDGAVHMEVPGLRSDMIDGATRTPIDSRYQPAYVKTGVLALLKFGGISGSVIGFGQLVIQPATADAADEFPNLSVDLDPSVPRHFSEGVRGMNEYFGAVFMNGELGNDGNRALLADSWIQMLDATFWSVPMYGTRPS